MRGKPSITVLNSAGAAVAGASVQIRQRPDAPATIYAQEEAGGALTNPAVTDSKGRISGWLEKGAYTANISGTGITSYSEHFDIIPTDYIGPALVTTLPSSPIPGHEVFFLASDTLGIVWHLLFVDGYWHYLGGPPLRHYVQGPLAVSAPTSVTTLSSGPSVAIPEIGFWTVEGGATVSNNPATGGDEGLSVPLRIGGNTVADTIGSGGTPRQALNDTNAMEQYFSRKHEHFVSSISNLQLGLFCSPARSVNLYDMTVAITPCRLEP
jgi:hypothetical protein